MSEYQYYEFQAVDRPLTERQMDELRRYSSRAQITSRSFINVYNYGDFGGSPDKLVEKYFDAFLYLANWGTRWLILRVSKKLLDRKTAAAYATGDCLSFRHKGKYVILSFRSEAEAEYDEEDGEGSLVELLPIRAALMRGDHRALYLGWLLAVQEEEVVDDALEPTVPPGLGELDAPLARLADFLRLDTDLIAAAAEESAASRSVSLSKRHIGDWISRLPGEARDKLLAKLIFDADPHLIVELQQQALDASCGAAAKSPAPPRTAADLLERARVLGEARIEKESAERARDKAKKARAAARRRKKYLESLTGTENSLWRKVRQLIDTRQAKPYDQAVSFLRDLRDLAQMRDDASAFTVRMAALHAKHARKSALVRRFRQAKLID